MKNKRFNYSECDNLNKLFKYLDDCLNDGFLDYKHNEIEEEVLIEIFESDDENDDIEDEIYGNLTKKHDLIEDVEDIDFSDEDYDDFYDSDNMEDY